MGLEKVVMDRGDMAGPGSLKWNLEKWFGAAEVWGLDLDKLV